MPLFGISIHFKILIHKNIFIIFVIITSRMDSKLLFRRDYFILLLLSVLYFFTVKNLISFKIYLILALIVSFYFFPIKLLLDLKNLKSTKTPALIIGLSYFIIGNIIALSVLTSLKGDFNFLHMAVSIYGILNIGFLIYFYFKNINYNFRLAIFATLLISAIFVL